MSFISWDALEAHRTKYGSSGLPSVIDAAKTFLCGLNENRFSFTNFDPTGFGNTLSGTWDRICDRKEEPPRDAGQPGRCRWIFQVSVPVQNGFNPNPEPNETYQFEIRSYSTPVLTELENSVQVQAWIGLGGVSNLNTTYGSGRTWKKEYGNARILSTTLESCISPPNEVAPPIPPIKPTPTPSPTDTTKQLPVQISPQITVPLFFVYVRPTFNFNPNTTVNFDIRPQINLPDLNLNLKFDVAGIEFNFYGGGDSTQYPNPQPDNRSPIPLPPSEESPSVDLSTVYQKLDDIIDCTCEKQTLTSQGLGEGDSGVFTLPQNTIAVLVDLTTIPSNSRAESGRSAPTVYYAGWASMSQSGFGSERLPLNYKQNWFKIQPYQKQFFFTCRTGFRATITAVLAT